MANYCDTYTVACFQARNCYNGSVRLLICMNSFQLNALNAIRLICWSFNRTEMSLNCGFLETRDTFHQPCQSLNPIAKAAQRLHKWWTEFETQRFRDLSLVCLQFYTSLGSCPNSELPKPEKLYAYVFVFHSYIAFLDSFAVKIITGQVRESNQGVR